MSGIAGLVNLDGAPAEPSEIQAMLARMVHRGPDGSRWWRQEKVALGHLALGTTPGSREGSYPFVGQGGLCLTADLRLDNQQELRELLGLPGASEEEIVLAAYRRWGPSFPARLLGDFALALWDREQRTLICARDPFGVRPLVYHRTSRLFTFASEVRALLCLPRVPRRIDEGRVADFLVPLLEGIDQTSTFYRDIQRLPPAHVLVVGPETSRVERYWRLDPTRELRFSRQDDYVEGFRERFSQAVRSRLQGCERAGVMLSGGIDSAAIAVVGSQMATPPVTYSAVGNEGEETRCIRTVIDHLGLRARTVSPAQAEELQPHPRDLVRDLDDPFDSDLASVPALMYAAARREGTRVVLDGVDGDLVTSHGTAYLAYLAREGHWGRLWGEARDTAKFLGCSRAELLLTALRQAFLPNTLRWLVWHLDRRLAGPRLVRESSIDRAFAARVGIAERRARQRSNQGVPRLTTLREATARLLEAPFITVALERYERVASAHGIEARHPFFDRRLVEYCLALPEAQKVSGGMSKLILRRSFQHRLPREVCWGRPRQHVALQFWKKLFWRAGDWLGEPLRSHRLDGYVDRARLSRLPDQEFELWQVAVLDTWLAEQAQGSRSCHGCLDTQEMSDFEVGRHVH